MTTKPEYVEVRGRSLQVIRVPPAAGEPVLAALLKDAGLPTEVPVVVLVGGAGGLNPHDADACRHLFTSALIPVVEEAGAILVDGGTDSGIMALAGRARHRAGSLSPHVGVVAQGTVRWPGNPVTRGDAADFEPHHTHIVAVPGDQWGDETPWLSAVASVLAGDMPTLTVLANGGEVAYRDVHQSLVAGRPVLVLSGTGRTAAQIVAARAGEPTDPGAAELAASPMLTTTPADAGTVRTALAAALGL